MNLFPKVRTPYYICAPSYTHTSSGVRALHLLCHALNESGQKAYLFPLYEGILAVNPELNTPIVTQDQVQFYKETLDPIVIYSDVMKGNPLDSNKVVRYLLASAGKYGGDATFPESDQVWSYTHSIAREQNSDRVLCIPTFDQNIFYSSLEVEREGSCFYAHKYDKIHGNELLDITKDSIRLEGKPEEIAAILGRSKVCYVYEMSEIIVNAELCGCPVVLIRTPYFNELPIDLDFTYFSARWSDQPEDKPVEFLANKQSHKIQDLTWEFNCQLERFIKETQSWKS